MKLLNNLALILSIGCSSSGEEQYRFNNPASNEADGSALNPLDGGQIDASHHLISDAGSTDIDTHLNDAGHAALINIETDAGAEHKFAIFNHQDSGKIIVWEYGDSLTFGEKFNGSFAGGYREPLYYWTVNNNLPVYFEGVYSTGTWTDPKHNGMTGYTIEQLYTYAHYEYGSANIPIADVIIFMAGTNNAVGIAIVYNGEQAIADYINEIKFFQSKNSDTYIVVTTIGDLFSEAQHSNVLDFNERLKPAWDVIDLQRPSHSPKLLRNDAYQDLGGRFSAPCYDMTSKNAHWTDTGYARVALGFERTLQTAN